MVFRDNFRGCPACGAALDEERHLGHPFAACGACDGIWIDAATLTCMFRDMDAERPAPELTPRLGDVHACPECRARMEAVALVGQAVQRCARHGVWIGRSQLEQALRQFATT